MRTLIALGVAVLLLIAAGHFATTTVTEKIGQRCLSGEEAGMVKYANSWEDTYLVTSWLPQRNQNNSFVGCVGPSQYLRYHPVDVAAVSFLGALTAGFIAYRNETIHTKKPKQKETK